MAHTPQRRATRADMRAEPVAETSAGPPRVAVACIKWGDRYGPEYVNVLARAVAEHLSLPHRFVCVTDDPAGLDPRVEAHPFPDIGLPKDRWKGGSWPKIALFAPGLFADDEIVLYLDIDVLILGPLDAFVDCVVRKPGFHTLQEWNPSFYRLIPHRWRPVRGSQGSVYVWRAGMQRHLWTAFTANAAHVKAHYWSDRFFLPALAVSPHYLPYELTASFKRHCVWYWPFNRLFPTPRRPGFGSVLVFHGNPNPTVLIGDDPRQRWGNWRKFGYGPVPFVKDYWARYSRP